MTTIKAKRKGRGVRKTSTITTTGDSLPTGALFTIAGVGIGERGQTVIGGRNVDDGKKAESVTLTVFRVLEKV